MDYLKKETKRAFKIYGITDDKFVTKILCNTFIKYKSQIIVEILHFLIY